MPPLSSSTERAIFWLSLIHSLRWKTTGVKRLSPASWSNSCDARVGHAGEVARRLDDGELHAEADAEVGDLVLAGEAGGVDHALGPAFAEAAGDEDGVVALEPGGGVLALEDLAVDPLGADADAVGHAAVGQRLGDGFVGVLELRVLADDGDADLALGVV